jgi:hypothetical protein
MAVCLIGLVPFATAQVITSVTPGSGTPGKTVDVVVRGVNTHFQNGVSIASFGSGINVLKFRVSNALTGTATIQIANNASPGNNTVSVQTGNELAELPNGFEIFAGIGNLRANIELLPVESISLADIDLTVPQNTPILYFVNVYNDNTLRYVNISVKLTSQSRGYIGVMTKNGVQLNANQYLRITNKDFTKVALNGSAGNEFLKQVKILGTFPPDDYIYKLEITDDQGQVLISDEVPTTVTNPRYNPELITPGATFDRDMEDVYSPFPLFQWFGQMDNYDLALYEARPNQTPEEVVRNIVVFQQKDINATSLLYPAYAEKLIPGKTYAWQIQGKIATGKGVQKLPSEVFRFRYMEPGTTPPEKLVSKIEIVPQEITLGEGEQIQFTAIIYDQDSNIVQTLQPHWQLSSAKGTITRQGLFVAGNYTGTLAVIVKAGAITEYAVVNLKTKVDTDAWLMKDMLRQLFGLPNQ